MLNLANECAERGVKEDPLLSRAEGPTLSSCILR